MQMDAGTQRPSEDLAAEVLRLRRDNGSLMELNAALKEGNTALKDANVVLKELVNSLQQERPALLSQPAQHQPCAGGGPAAAVSIFLLLTNTTLMVSSVRLVALPGADVWHSQAPARVAVAYLPGDDPPERLLWPVRPSWTANPLVCLFCNSKGPHVGL